MRIIHPPYPSSLSPGSTAPRTLFLCFIYALAPLAGRYPRLTRAEIQAAQAYGRCYHRPRDYLAACALTGANTLMATPTLSFLADKSCDFAAARALRGSGERSLGMVRRPVIGAEPDKESRTSTLSR